MAKRSNRQVVPASREALQQMKYEIAAELGLYVSTAGASGSAPADTEFATELGSAFSASSSSSSSASSSYVPWTQLATREAGSVGGEMTRRLIRQAEQTLGALEK